MITALVAGHRVELCSLAYEANGLPVPLPAVLSARLELAASGLGNRRPFQSGFESVSPCGVEPHHPPSEGRVV